MLTPRFFSLIAALISLLILKANSHADYPLLPVPQKIELTDRTVVVKSASVEFPEWQNDWTETVAANGIKVEATAHYKINGRIVNGIDGTPQAKCVPLAFDRQSGVENGKQDISDA